MKVKVRKQDSGINTKNNTSVRMKNSIAGITLIALVLTIIVLLILAGVAIVTLTGENGILTQASKAKDKTTEATAIEKVQVEVLGSYGTDGNIDINALNKNLRNISGLTYEGAELSDSNRIESLPAMVTLNGYDIIIDENGNVSKKVTVLDAKTNGTVFGDNTTIYDTYENSVKIPAGFKIASDSATDVTGGIVIEDATYDNTKESQFVWIPVGTGENAIKKSDEITVGIALDRYTFDPTNGNQTAQGSSVIDSYFRELSASTYGNTVAKEIEVFKTKVNSSHGYYIGRYEARKSSRGNLTVVGTDSVYNNIAQTDAATASRNMYKDLPFTSDLMNSYAWDTAIVFEQIFDNRTTDKTKPYSRQNSLNAGSIATTGTNNLTDTNTQDKICNIWDMASNCYEWTTENCNLSNVPCVFRGGALGNGGNYTSTRFPNSDDAFSYTSFRPLLYL